MIRIGFLKSFYASSMAIISILCLYVGPQAVRAQDTIPLCHEITAPWTGKIYAPWTGKIYIDYSLPNTTSLLDMLNPNDSFGYPFLLLIPWWDPTFPELGYTPSMNMFSANIDITRYLNMVSGCYTPTVAHPYENIQPLSQGGTEEPLAGPSYQCESETCCTCTQGYLILEGDDIVMRPASSPPAY